MTRLHYSHLQQSESAYQAELLSAPVVSSSREAVVMARRAMVRKAMRQPLWRRIMSWLGL